MGKHFKEANSFV